MKPAPDRTPFVALLVVWSVLGILLTLMARVPDENTSTFVGVFVFGTISIMLLTRTIIRRIDNGIRPVANPGKRIILHQATELNAIVTYDFGRYIEFVSLDQDLLPLLGDNHEAVVGRAIWRDYGWIIENHYPSFNRSSFWDDAVSDPELFEDQADSNQTRLEAESGNLGIQDREDFVFALGGPNALVRSLGAVRTLSDSVLKREATRKTRELIACLAKTSTVRRALVFTRNLKEIVFPQDVFTSAVQTRLDELQSTNTLVESRRSNRAEVDRLIQGILRLKERHILRPFLQSHSLNDLCLLLDRFQLTEERLRSAPASKEIAVSNDPRSLVKWSLLISWGGAGDLPNLSRNE